MISKFSKVVFENIEHRVLLIDTPGFGDNEPKFNANIKDEFINALENITYVDSILIVVNERVRDNFKELAELL